MPSSQQEPPLIRSLLNADGSVFDDELDAIVEVLAELANTDRINYRNRNASDIAVTDAARVLVVAGPGAGKSHLFLARIEFWLPSYSDASIYVATFVRKLVRDLRADVAAKLPAEVQGQVTVATLHALARSIVERNQGTRELRLSSHVKVITQDWQQVVWDDVLQFHTDLRGQTYSHRRYTNQLNAELLDNSIEWRGVRTTYGLLRSFFNAVGFSDMIVVAREAIEENPSLNEHLLWIIDEYQDFNAAEDHLISAITEAAAGVMIAGDDEQALYQALKSSTPDIICDYYRQNEFANAMLPYCSRCDYYICLAASAFMARYRLDDAIKKIYLPLKHDESATRVQVVATRVSPTGRTPSALA